MRTALSLLVLSVAIGAQQRDTPVVATGTAAITGTVVNAGGQPLPLRRVVVTISGEGLTVARSTITDDRGRFAFAKLPAGSYALTAKKASYLATEFASPAPGRPGSRIAVAAGESRAVTLAMFKGAAIGGTLRHPDGSPVPGVTVTAMNVRSIGKRPPDPPEETVTNDRGEYRIYGLMPGDYLVAASPSAGGTGEIGARPAPAMDALLAALTDRRTRAGATAPTDAPPLPSAPSVGYTPIFFPGTPFYAEAERIRLGTGDDRDALSFTVDRVPVASIEGTIGEMASFTSVQLAIVPDAWELRMNAPGSMTMTGVPPNADGEFKFGNLSPGMYRIVARGRRVIPGSAASSAGAVVFAIADVEVRGRDVKGVPLVLQPGGSISGKLVFDSGGTAVPDLSMIRIGASIVGAASYYQQAGLRVGNALSEVSPVALKADGTFELSGLGPSSYVLTCVLPNNLTPIWLLRSAIVDGRDLLDTAVTGPFVTVSGVAVTLSDKRTEITGSLLSATGQPASEYYVIAFSTDRVHWRVGSRRLVSARPATDGRFVFRDLPAGEYFIAALTDLDPAAWQDPAFLDQVAPAAFKISIVEGEKKTQDLRIR